MKSVLTSANIDYSILGAKGFEETSNYLNSYVKVVLKSDDPEEDGADGWMKTHFAKLKQVSDELVKV